MEGWASKKPGRPHAGSSLEILQPMSNVQYPKPNTKHPICNAQLKTPIPHRQQLNSSRLTDTNCISYGKFEDRMICEGSENRIK